MKKLIGLLMLCGFLTYCWFAYDKYEKMRQNDVDKENIALKAEVEKVKAENDKIRQVQQQRIADIKKVILVIFGQDPKSVEQIEKAFTVPPTVLAAATGKVGEEFKYVIGESHTAGSIKYCVSVVTPLPAGLSINSEAGLIDGKPTTAGTNVVTINVVGPNNETKVNSLTITINP